MKNEEHKIQAGIVAAADLIIPGRLYAVPNGGNRSAITGAMLKREGVRRGVPDLQLDMARGGFHGLRMEVKTPKGRLTLEQREWRDWVRAQGYKYHVVRSVQQGVNVLQAYLEGGLPL